jgi:isopentenyl diphosphate isomerase/L-lactate dehydrogenase-like FMN-dependent dehydrogenase
LKVSRGQSKYTAEWEKKFFSVVVAKVLRRVLRWREGEWMRETWCQRLYKIDGEKDDVS